MKIFLILLFLLPLSSDARDFLNFLSPDSPATSIEVEGIYLPNSEMEGGEDNTQISNVAVGVNQRVFQDNKTMVSVGAKYQKLDLTAESPFLNDFYNQQGTVSLKRQLPEDNFWLTSVSYGSASDRPFKSNRDNTLGINYIQKVNSKWFLAANYSNNRAFLNGVPLPGFIYIKEMSREKMFVVGFPFILWARPLSENWSIRYFGLIPWSHHLKFFYNKWGFIRPYLGFEQSPQTYFRFDRESRYDRFFWFERRIALGVEGKLSRGFKYDLSGGYAFDRQFFEARNFSQSKEFLINVENAYFASLNLRYNFN